MDSKVNILGTGLTGLVGSRMEELLNKEFDFEPISLSNGEDIIRIETIEKKIANSSAPFLVHLASFTDVSAAFKETGNQNGFCYLINVLGTKNIATLCAKYNKFLINFSTDFVFDGKKDTPYTEEDTPNPIDWYGQTKFIAEEEIKKSGVKYCNVRIAYPYRASFDRKIDLIRKTIADLKSNTLYPMFNDKIITPTFIDDIALGTREIILKKTEGNLHLVGSSFISHFEMTKKIAEIFGFEPKLVKEGSLEQYLISNPTGRVYPKNLSLSNQKAKQTLGVRLRTIEEGLWEMKQQMAV